MNNTDVPVPTLLVYGGNTVLRAAENEIRAQRGCLAARRMEGLGEEFRRAQAGVGRQSDFSGER
jgi:hypothetical protein